MSTPGDAERVTPDPAVHALAAFWIASKLIGMNVRVLVLVHCMLVAGCGGSVVETGTGGATGSGGKQSAGGLTGAGGLPGCPPIPKAPEYDCELHAALPTDCGPWTPDGKREPNLSVGYPQNCNVRLPRPDAFSGGCGPQQCQCSQFPDANGTFTPDWVCPL